MSGAEGSGGQDWGEAIGRELEQWRREHPRATFAEIEAAVEEQLSRVRAELVSREVTQRAGAESGVQRVPCPTCGEPTEARGSRERQVTVRGDRPVRLKRRYHVCPACGAGFFPPG